MTIQFENVGQHKLCWSEDLDGSEQAILRALKKKSALISRGIDVVWDENGSGGAIFVGGFRCVGKFKVEKQGEIALPA